MISVLRRKNDGKAIAMSIIENENAAQRINFVSEIYQKGIEDEKKRILESINPRYSVLHKKGYIHIHDLESYGKVYNCSMPNVMQDFFFEDCTKISDHTKICQIFNYYKSLIINLGIEQSGGIGFGNFDLEINFICKELKIRYSTSNIEFFRENIREFIKWINTNKTRYCREPYYLSFNIGLCTESWGRKTTEFILQEFYESPLMYTRPNIIFKVNNKINSNNTSRNYNLYQLALKCTAKRMIPTYLLTDSIVNKEINPENIAIMGCRTRVFQNINGEETAIGRGNIAYVSLNLPRLSLESKSIEDFYINLNELMIVAAELLKDRKEQIIESKGKYLSYARKSNVWGNNTSLKDMINSGTLSIGFIGLAEAVEVLTSNKIYENKNSLKLSYEIIKYMRLFVDTQREKYQLNYSLLATPGEMISGRFCEIDKNLFNHSIQQKEFYTNSFHVEVNSRISLFDKIDIEAPFHKFCNGGCITYIELKAAPLDNILGLMDSVEYAIQKGISYLGFNYPLDICNTCGASGTFDICNNCGSSDIKQIRRVSGYLEDCNYFTKGKKAEIKVRKANI